MKELIRVAVAALLASTLVLSTAVANEIGPLIEAQTLSEKLDNDLLLIDIRGDDKEGASLFEAGHIAGSVNAPYGQFRGPKENPGQLVNEAHVQELLRSIGAKADQQVVVVYQGANDTDFGAAARVYWTLKSAGFEDLAILNGGVNTWTAAGLPLDTGPVEITASTIEIYFSDQWLATTEDVLNVTSGAAKARLLDARPETFWNGEKKHPAASSPGTLPTSSYYVHSQWFGNSPAINGADEVRTLAEQAGFTKTDEPIVSFCNTGHWAATNWFALSELSAIENVKLYPESMVGYTNAGHEVMNKPGLIKNLIKKIGG